MIFVLLQLKKCIDENIEIPLLWEDLSYYRRFGFEDALEPKKQINPLLIEEYFKNPDLYFRARCLMVIRLEREIVSSRQFKEYLRNWQVQAFLTSCLRYDETQDYSMFYNTKTVRSQSRSRSRSNSASRKRKDNTFQFKNMLELFEYMETVIENQDVENIQVICVEMFLYISKTL